MRTSIGIFSGKSDRFRNRSNRNLALLKDEGLDILDWKKNLQRKQEANDALKRISIPVYRAPNKIR